MRTVTVTYETRQGEPGWGDGSMPLCGFYMWDSDVVGDGWCSIQSHKTGNGSIDFKKDCDNCHVLREKIREQNEG